MIVIPAIDLLGGQAVRLEQGRYDRVTVYDTVPELRARAFAEDGAERVHVVDLEGARDGQPRQQVVVERIVRALGIPVQVGGGIRTLDDARSVMAAGAGWVVMGTAAVKDPEVLQRTCAELAGSVIVAIDARGGKVAIEGWTATSDRDAVDLAREVAAAGAAGILYTDVERDGMRGGPNLEATRDVAAAVPISVLASGGVSSLADLRDLAALDPPLGGVIVGRALYANAFLLADAIQAVATRSSETGH